MIGTELLQGMGLGNRLFCYVTARCIAADRHVPFGIAGWEYMQADFLDLDRGEAITASLAGQMAHYHEAEKRLYLANSPHDMVHGCYVAGADPGIFQVADNTLLYGNLQSEDYFRAHKEDIRHWLYVKEEAALDLMGTGSKDSIPGQYDYTDDNLCILNVRGGEYAGDPALFLAKSYWIHAMKIMAAMNPSMRFMIVTDDPESARKLLPGIPAHHFDPAKDYITLKNARYLIVSNSSFAFFPAYTSLTLKRVIAPRYWARYNVSDGYWASEQNIYDEFEYLDRNGKLYTAMQCREELRQYQYPQTSPWAADDPAVTTVRKRNERRRLLTMAVHKAERVFNRGRS